MIESFLACAVAPEPLVAICAFSGLFLAMVVDVSLRDRSG